MTVKDQISKKNKEISGFIDEIRVSHAKFGTRVNS